MNIQKCLLNTNNHFSLPRGELAYQLIESGRSHIWQERKSIVDTIVIHYMSAVEVTPADPFSLEECLQILVTYDVSSHYLIDRVGNIFQLVPDDKKAWHCGGSVMPSPDNREGVNDFSIGIELMATKDSGFTDEQYDSLKELCKQLEMQFDIKQYTGHEYIAGKKAVECGIRKDVKIDPGPLFNWEILGVNPIM